MKSKRVDETEKVNEMQDGFQETQKDFKISSQVSRNRNPVEVERVKKRK